LVIGLVTAGLLLLTLYGKVRGERLAMLFLLLVLVDLLWTGRQWVTWQGPDVWLGRQAALAERLLADDAGRAYSPTYSLEQQVAAAYGLRLFGGIDPFQLSGVVQAIGQGGGVSETIYSVVQPPLIGVTGNDLAEANRGAVLDTRTLAEWGVSHVIAAYPLEDDRLEWVDTVDGALIYRNRDFVPESAARLPDWPSDWPGLPDGAQVEHYNRITLLAALVSAVSLLGTLAFLAVGFRRKSPHIHPIIPVATG
ncbi:MAG: hypothetical protein K8I60_15975, partial [Anaerolineae bacterium]|nr:hypothetical protein [Anaerolineae bacterium]